MDDARGQVTGSAAETYERFFVPALFAEWAPRVADAARIGESSAVLDVACGTGVLAREARERASGGRVVGLDCNPGMLRVGRDLAPSVEWQEGRAEDLPFEDGSFDAVLSQFGLMFFEDRGGAIREMWRVLRPGGRMVVAVWGALDQTPGYAAMVALLDRLFGENIANELRAPFALGDPSALRALLAEAGVPAPNVMTIVGRARFPSIAEWVRTDIRGWTLADLIDDEELALLTREAEAHLQPFVEEDGVGFASPAILAWAEKG